MFKEGEEEEMAVRKPFPKDAKNMDQLEWDVLKVDVCGKEEDEEMSWRFQCHASVSPSESTFDGSSSSVSELFEDEFAVVECDKDEFDGAVIPAVPTSFANSFIALFRYPQVS
jgi:hypothetical protein